MLVTVTLPWFHAAQVNRSYDIFMVDCKPSEYAGEVYTGSIATSLIDGKQVKLPPYMRADDLGCFLQSMFNSPEYKASNGALLD